MHLHLTRGVTVTSFIARQCHRAQIVLWFEVISLAEVTKTRRRLGRAQLNFEPNRILPPNLTSHARSDFCQAAFHSGAIMVNPKNICHKPTSYSDNKSFDELFGCQPVQIAN